MTCRRSACSWRSSWRVFSARCSAMARAPCQVSGRYWAEASSRSAAWAACWRILSRKASVSLRDWMESSTARSSCWTAKRASSRARRPLAYSDCRPWNSPSAESSRRTSTASMAIPPPESGKETCTLCGSTASGSGAERRTWVPAGRATRPSRDTWAEPDVYTITPVTRASRDGGSAARSQPGRNTTANSNTNGFRNMGPPESAGFHAGTVSGAILCRKWASAEKKTVAGPTRSPFPHAPGPRRLEFALQAHCNPLPICHLLLPQH